MTHPSSPHDPQLFSVRTTLIVLLACVASGTIAACTFLARHSGPEAILAAIVSLPGAVTFFNKLISHDL